MYLWLDDFRLPPQDGRAWVWAKNIETAKRYLETEPVTFASLDHDMGACADCLGGLTPEEWLERHTYRSMPHCDHLGTGYTLVCWMEMTGHWPLEKPVVHSMNPDGRKRMQLAIDRHYDHGPVSPVPVEERPHGTPVLAANEDPAQTGERADPEGAPRAAVARPLGRQNRRRTPPVDPTLDGGRPRSVGFTLTVTLESVAEGEAVDVVADAYRRLSDLIDASEIVAWETQTASVDGEDLSDADLDTALLLSQPGVTYETE